jgi:hypothetical protein
LVEGNQEQLTFVKFRKEQDALLLAEGFEPAGSGLWIRDGTFFGREAALQYAHSRLLQRGGYAGDAQPPRRIEEGKAF